MQVPENVQKELTTALQTIARYAIADKSCYLCGEKTKIARGTFNFRPYKGAIYIRYLLICPRCDEHRANEVDKLKKGDRFDFGVFDV